MKKILIAVLVILVVMGGSSIAVFAFGPGLSYKNYINNLLNLEQNKLKSMHTFTSVASSKVVWTTANFSSTLSFTIHASPPAWAVVNVTGSPVDVNVNWLGDVNHNGGSLYSSYVCITNYTITGRILSLGMVDVYIFPCGTASPQTVRYQVGYLH